MVTDFKLYYKAKLIKTVWDWISIQTHRSVDQEREFRMKTHIYGQLISENEAKNTQGEEDGLFTMVLKTR